MTFAAAPNPTLVESVIVSASSILYPSPPFTIITSVNIPVRIAESSTPVAVVAVIVSPIAKAPTKVVTTNSTIGTVPTLRVVTLETNAVAEEVFPVIVNPLKFKYVESLLNCKTVSCNQLPSEILNISVFG